MLNRAMTIFAVSIGVVVYLDGWSEAASRASFQRTDMPLLETVRNEMRHGYENCTLYAGEKRVDCSKRHLTFVPSDLPQYTKYLDLFKNQIQTLWNNSFSRYIHLTWLDLSFNDISKIEHAAFKPLTELINLNLLSNSHLRLSDGIFEWSRLLQYVDMSGCGLTSLPKDIAVSTNLIALSLFGNKLASVNLTSCTMQENGSIELPFNHIHSIIPETFALDCNCDCLDITSNPIQSVNPDAIASLRVRHILFGGDNISSTTWTHFLEGVARSSVKELDISVTGFDQIPSDFFDALEDYPLNVLRLDNTLDIYPHVFRKLTKVSSLSLWKNGIKILRPEYFSGMTGLIELDLSSNLISSINPSNSSWDVNLTSLDLSTNKLTEIKPFAFHGLDNLAILDLDQNDLSVVYLDSFAVLQNLRTLNLAMVGILLSFSINVPNLVSLIFQSTVLGRCLKPGDTFKYTPSLEILVMADSNIVTYDLRNHTSNASLFQGLHSLRFLDLEENLFHELPSGVFQELWSLIELDLSACEIRSIESGAFQGLKSLQTLLLQNNQIHNFHPASLNDLPNLSIFHADNNELSSLDQDFFKRNSFIINITLSNNRLAGFNKSTFDPVQSSLESIEISGNPLVCDCHIRWLVDWLHSSLQIQSVNETICSPALATLEPFRGKPLMNFDPKGLCDPNVTLYTAMTVCGLAALVILMLMYHNRWRLKYKLFLLKLAVLGYREIHDARDPEDFDFDLNVIFTDEGEEWVQSQLRPFVTESCPHLARNVFGDEDLFLGMHVLDAVLHAVENSFKTLIIISAAAVNDQWFMTKFRIALNHVNDAQTENVVLVFLEDVADDELPFLVRLFLNDHGSYLQWTNDAAGQRYFWKGLTKYLSVNRRTDRRIPIE